MYRLYVIECSKNNLQPQKKHMYRKVFNEQYNFSFHPPSKDTCEKCDIFKAAIISAEEKEKSAIKAKKEQHLSKAELAYDQKSKDKAYAAASDDSVTANFDLQKVLPCSHLKTVVVYYKRQFSYIQSNHFWDN